MTLESLTLLEYRPGRYAWADERGEVVRLATTEEADAELGRLMGLETLPLFALDLDRDNGGNGDGQPASVTVANDAHQAETSPSGNRRGPVVFVAYQDRGEMTPANDGGRLMLYPDRDAARAAAGILGVAAAVPWARLPQLCKEHGLKMPSNGREVVTK